MTECLASNSSRTIIRPSVILCRRNVAVYFPIALDFRGNGIASMFAAMLCCSALEPDCTEDNLNGLG
ncbi:hypothetical protein SeMB42_g05301 [Synchytrium endobioticum]|uniref:Uncharacterized protein n=1 Tax=Synchytrium endobioticum TaxID=286115 RepID=A0A507CSG5_9FUNG|nr:hypothetical protein SeMB42_g05301 [Synchytrium endobioticum]